METIKNLDEQLENRNKEIKKIDDQIAEIDVQVEELKQKYPKLFTPPAFQEAKQLVESAAGSDWYNDQVQIEEDEKSLLLNNLSKKERLQEQINLAKIEAGDLAFKIVEMTEKNSTTHQRDTLQSKILELKDKVKEATEDLRKMDSTQVHWAYSGYRTDPMQNRNGALIAAIAIIKPKELYGKKISFKELLNTLREEFKTNLDEKSRDLIMETHRELVQKRNDLYHQRYAL